MISGTKRAWFILDEIAVECASRGPQSISDRAIEAMEQLPEKPTPDECKILYEERNQ